MKGLKILVGVSGGIAAYKTATLIRLLVKAGCDVKVVMTPNAREFITPLTLATLSGHGVISDFFTANTGEWHSHVSLGLWADAMVIAPATASTMAKMAAGVADNMLVTTYLSMRAPVFVAPAMDMDMYAHPTTKRNIELLHSYGCHILEPGDGELASHLCGKGRMQEPEEIFNALRDFFAKRRTMAGKHVLITSGPTHEKLDPVRFIGNYSTGKMGAALAEECADRGADVTLIAGPGSVIPVHDNIAVVQVVSARQMHQAALNEFTRSDLAIMAAAVADYAPAVCAENKIKREKQGRMSIELVPNPDIAADLGQRKKPGQILVGFALETDHELENAKEKKGRKNLDYIVLNSLRNPKAGFGVDTNCVTVIGPGDAVSEFQVKPKREVAADIIDTIFPVA